MAATTYDPPFLVDGGRILAKLDLKHISLLQTNSKWDADRPDWISRQAIQGAETKPLPDLFKTPRNEHERIIEPAHRHP